MHASSLVSRHAPFSILTDTSAPASNSAPIDIFPLITVTILLTVPLTHPLTLLLALPLMLLLTLPLTFRFTIPLTLS